MSSGTGSRGIPVVLGVLAVVGAVFGWPYAKKWINKPETVTEATAPTVPSSLTRDPYAGMTSAQIRDDLLKTVQAGLRPDFSALMRLDPDDFKQVQDAKAGAVKKPWEVKSSAQLVKENFTLVQPKLTDELLAAMLGLHKDGTARPLVPAVKTYSPEELAAAVQPAVPMIRVRDTVRCVVDHTAPDADPKSKKPPVTTRHTLEVQLGGSGSGFFIDAGGHIVTNWHVTSTPPSPEDVRVQAAKKLGAKAGHTVRLVGTPKLLSTDITIVVQGKHRPFAKSLPAVGPAEAERPFTLPAKLIGSDEASDLAVLKVDGCTFPYLTFGDPAGLKVGQAVMSVGYPKGDDIPGDPTAIDGNVSGLNRSPLDGTKADSVQHSAHISHGSSGGPLLDRAGRVVGVNTYGFADPMVKGVNFSRGPRTAAPFVEQIIRLGRVVRPDAGVVVFSRDFRDLPEGKAGRLADSQAMVVLRATMGNPAEPGDVILAVGGQQVTTSGEWEDALGLLEKTRPTTVRMTVQRASGELRARAKSPADWIAVLIAALQMKETEITVPLTWPK